MTDIWPAFPACGTRTVSYTHLDVYKRQLNNERLEFLGDAILDAIGGDIVYKRFEGKREGFLTNTRSKIVHMGVSTPVRNVPA